MPTDRPPDGTPHHEGGGGFLVINGRAYRRRPANLRETLRRRTQMRALGEIGAEYKRKRLLRER